jgi:hypothetical protein
VIRPNKCWAALAAIAISYSALAQDTQVERDEQAIAVLKGMSTYISGLDEFVITGTALTDTRLDAGLIVASPTEVELTVDRPGSLHMKQFDGEHSKDLYIHDGTLSLYESESSFYANSSVPVDIEAGMEYALDELGIEMPLADLIGKDVFSNLAGTSYPVLYISDKSRVAGVDCHHLAIRMDDADVQIWIQEGAQHVPRRMIITSKWDGGAPRFVAVMNWNFSPDIDRDAFKFKPPENARRIEFEPADWD